MSNETQSSGRFAPVVSLAVLVWRSQKLAEQEKSPKGRQEQLQTLARRLARIRSFELSSAPKHVGVFGAPNRGKSTLLNALLGYDLLPTSPMPLSTTTIEIVREVDRAGWEVEVHLANGRVEPHETDSDRSVANLLERYGSRRGATTAERIRVRGAFGGCRILNQGGVLLDTPGAEVAFEPDTPLGRETERALRALSETHVVLFCTRADQIGSRSDFEFFEEHIRPLAPVHVVTCKEKWTDGRDELLNSAMKQYGVSESNVVPVSAHEAMRARAVGADLGPSGLLELETHILGELDRLTPERGLLPCVQEFQRVVKEDHTLRPEKVHFENLRTSLRDGGAACVQSLNEIEKNADFWKLK